jgi:hypothetical protein
MIIYYKLPSYPKTTATLPFAKISAMRKKHLVNYYTNCAGVKRFRKDVQREKLPTFAREKRSGNCSRGRKSSESRTAQRETEIQKIMREVTGHFGALGRRVHSSGKKRQELSATERKKDCAGNVDGGKKLPEVPGKIEKVSENIDVARPVHSHSVHIS